MADSYYLLSKDTGDGPYLLGILMRLGEDEYEFKYLIKGDRFPHWFMQIPRLGDISRVYKTQEVLHYIIYRVVPEDDEWAAEVIMKNNGLRYYDEWTILELLINQHAQHMPHEQPLCDSHQLFYFYSEIPKNANRFD